MSQTPEQRICQHEWDNINDTCRVCSLCALSQHLKWTDDVILAEVHALPESRICGPHNPRKRHTWQYSPLPHATRLTSLRRHCVICSRVERRATLKAEWKRARK